MEENRGKIDQILAERARLDSILHSQYTKNIAVIFTDIKGSTSVYEQQGDISGRIMVHKHNEIIMPIIEKNGGVLIKTIGDGTMSMFDDPRNALHSAISMQKKMDEHNRQASKPEGQINIRIGINYGLGIVDDNDVFGDVVNVASRVEALADAGQILITDELYMAARNYDEFIFRYVDIVTVKGKKQPVKIYRLLWHEEEFTLGKTRNVSEVKQSRAGVFVIEATVSGDTIKVSGYDKTDGEEKAVRRYSEIPYNKEKLKTYTSGVIDLFNKANRRGRVGNEILVKLKEYGKLMYDELIPSDIKDQLAKTNESHLLISMDDSLVHLPWELLFDGNEFLCLKFNIGRTVSTKQAVVNVVRSVGVPLKVQIFSDPRGDLQAAYREGLSLKNQLSTLGDKTAVYMLTTDITSDIVKSKLHYFDIIHYAGHAEHDKENPERSGWLLKDGKLSGQDIRKARSSMPMPALVFSNACQSGHSDEWKISEDCEENIFGLANAFLLSGVQHYAGTFWEIPDEAGQHFSEYFYTALFGGETIGEAFRTARIKLLQQYGEDVIVWASYLLYGDPTIRYVDSSKPSDRANGNGGDRAEETLSGASKVDDPYSYAIPQSTLYSTRRGNHLYVAFAVLACLIVAIVGWRYIPTSQVVIEPKKTVDVNSGASSKRIDELVTALAADYRQNKVRKASDEWAPKPLTIVLIGVDYTVKSDANKEIFSSLLIGRLQSSERVRVVERELLDKLLEELKLSATELADPSTALKIGRILSARIMITGKVISDPAGSVVSLRLIDTETTEIKKVVTAAIEARELNKADIEGIGLQIADWASSAYPLKGTVTATDGERVTVNIGSSAGLKAGVKLKILGDKGNGGNYAGTLQVEEVAESSSSGRIVPKNGRIGKGSQVIEAVEK